MIINKSSLLFFPVIALAIIGVASLETFNFLPATLIIELTFFAVLAIIGMSYSRELLIYWWLNLGYMGYQYIVAVKFNHENIFDFIVSIKVFIYLAILFLFAKTKIITFLRLEKFYKWILALYFLKYSYSVLISGIDRPGIFAENNFELLIPLILSVGVWSIRGRANKWEVVVLIMIVILSGSRSGALELLLTLAYIPLIVERKINLTSLLAIIFSGLLALGLVSILILTRGATLESVDRFQFLLLFLNEAKEWNIFNWLFGMPPGTPLSAYTCEALNYYVDLFSKSGNGDCYSVIFHSMIMRMIFDHGILGLLFVLFALFKILNISGLAKKSNNVILLILLVNGLSVSSFNSVFAALPVLILVLAHQKQLQPKIFLLKKKNAAYAS
jgi:hypothetical protein